MFFENVIPKTQDVPMSTQPTRGLFNEIGELYIKLFFINVKKKIWFVKLVSKAQTYEM